MHVRYVVMLMRFCMNVCVFVVALPVLHMVALNAHHPYSFDYNHSDPIFSIVLGCGYLNGVGPVLITQMMILCGFLFSLSALGDCSFVELDQRLFLSEAPDLPVEVTQTQYIGLLTWQRLDG
jgi:hypothetical protein